MNNSIPLPSILTAMLLSLVLSACSTKQDAKNDEGKKADSIHESTIELPFTPKSFIIGDFNGDKLQDTVFEYYTSSQTQAVKEANLSNGVTASSQSIAGLYSSIAGIDTFSIKNTQQNGLLLLVNLGDLNGDKADEFGYVIDWADASNLNSYHIITLHDNRFRELFNFSINEKYLESSHQLENGKIIRSISPKAIEYQYYSDSGEFVIARHTFK